VLKIMHCVVKPKFHYADFHRNFPAGKVHDKVTDLSQTQIMKVGDMICVTDFHDLCSRQVRNFVANLSRTLSQSRRNGIWV